MLVCNVSLHPPRAAISVDLVEAATATATTATGIVFAALVDDPASAIDRVDARSGEIMLEAASANAAVDAGLNYNVAIVEAATAATVLDGAISAAPGTYAGALVEAATAADSVSATVVAAVTVFTTTGTMAVGPLFVIDATLSGSSVTVIDVGN